MRRIASTSRAIAVVLAAVAACATLARPDAAVAGAAPAVPSLDPAGTQARWHAADGRLAFQPAPVSADCRPLRAVFYAATDWLRLTTTLASRASPCAQYYVSIPPVVADKTKPRPDQAWRIRALGPAYHALAEIHLTAWQKWVASTGNGLVWRGRRGAAPDGCGRVRRQRRRLVGAQRALVRRQPRRRRLANRHPRVPPRPVRRGRRRAADPRRRVHRRDRPEGGGRLDVQGEHAGVAPGSRRSGAT